ncbi:MAG: inorganic phosphate transporter [Alphaproteobacteria bacterium]|nr:inorganic phosphate transporter [Alphaproteobacteria bacterium]
MLVLLLLVVTLFLAYANGANDNFKGVATLYGDGTLSYRQALSMATVAQIAGSIASVVFAAALVKAFSGKGLVAPELTSATDFLTAIGFGAAATVMLATVLGFPISTTHALTGALAGTAFVANNGSLDLSVIGKSFFLPLLVSPLLAITTAGMLYAGARWVSGKLNWANDSCFCISAPQTAAAMATPAGSTLSMAAPRRLMRIAKLEACQQEDLKADLLILPTRTIVSGLHFISAFALCFARGLNDTPKIVGVLFAAKAFSIDVSLSAVAIAMAVGGLLQSRKVAERMSKKVTPLDEPQALTANLVASFYVIAASRLGLPVSTTHISVSAISGVGLINRSANLRVIRDILLSWVLTLPIAAITGMILYTAFKTFGA